MGDCLEDGEGLIVVLMFTGHVSIWGAVILLGMSIGRLLDFYAELIFETYCESLASLASSSISPFSIVSFLFNFLLGDLCGIGDSAFKIVVVVLWLLSRDCYSYCYSLLAEEGQERGEFERDLDCIGGLFGKLGLFCCSWGEGWMGIQGREAEVGAVVVLISSLGMIWYAD